MKTKEDRLRRALVLALDHEGVRLPRSSMDEILSRTQEATTWENHYRFVNWKRNRT